MMMSVDADSRITKSINAKQPAYVLCAAAYEQAAFGWLRQRWSDAILTPNPIFPLNWGEGLRRISVHPVRPLGCIQVETR